MTVRELREKFLAFFQSKGHRLYPSGSLIPFDVTGRLDESLLFNGAGMVQFKPFFRGVAEPPHKRLTNCQKCVRTGDIDEVGDLTHLTFFEMLGNFSFGDYFKADAIAYSWEFLTSSEWLGLDPMRLSFTVFEDDDEAYGEWSKWISGAGMEAASRLMRLGEDTNYWPASAFSKGPPGPCGPNSEMFYWVSPEAVPPISGYTREDWIRDEGEGKWLEIWNDVFIQFEWQGHLRNPERLSDGFVKDAMPGLPFASIDTGMGLDRTAAVLMGGGSVYDTDSFAPIFRILDELLGGSSPERDAQDTHGRDAHATASRIIADHIRTAVFCIADGILPSNNGRGYVLRRLIRRAVLKGQRVLGFEEPFFHKVYEGVVESMGSHYTELVERRDVIVETLRNEEEQFRRTLSQGLEHLDRELWEMLEETIFAGGGLLKDAREELSAPTRRAYDSFVGASGGSAGHVAALRNALTTRDEFLLVFNQIRTLLKDANEGLFSSWKLKGADAFRLYDTYGFPLEVTVELAVEAGVEVDLEGYEQALKEAQERSRGGQERESVYSDLGITLLIEIEDEQTAPTQTVFVGYDQTHTQTQIVGALPETDDDGKATGKLVLALKESPFYAESGGQTSDTGIIAGGGFEGRVTDVIKQNGVWVHEVEPIHLSLDLKGKDGDDELIATVQKKLFRLSVEAEVDAPRRDRITRNHTATHLLHAALRSVLGKHVTQAGSYVGPDRLRFDFTHGKGMSDAELAEVEQIVNEQVLKNTLVTIYQDLPIAEAKARGAMALFGEKYGDKVRMVEIGEFSKELCGGIHVGHTGQIGLFKIGHESSAASGVRRIEALTGEGAYEWILEMVEGLHQATGKLKLPPKSGIKDVLNGIDRLFETQRDLKHRLEKARTQAPAAGPGNIQTIGSVELAVEALKDGDAKDATALADQLAANQPSRVVLVGAVSEGKITFVCKVGADALAKGAHAGNIVREVAKIAGGGGGGRPDFATAGGKDPSKLDEALAAAAGLVAAMVKG